MLFTGTERTVEVSLLNPTGGEVIFDTKANVYQLELRASGLARFNQLSCVDTVLLTDNSALSINDVLNVKNSFNWTGTGVASITSDTSYSGKLCYYNL